MTSLPLKFGPLYAEGFLIKRSGVTWLCEDGHICKPNEVIAYCNIGLERIAGRRIAANPFADERELQVAFAPRIAGRVRKASGTSPGGHLGHLGVQPWDPSGVLGFLELLNDTETCEPLRLLVLAGRRASAFSNVEIGLLPGWHSRSRGWWSDENSAESFQIPTLLSLGICDSTGPVRGDLGAFTEMFETAPFPAQIVFVSDQPVTPCAPVLLEQFARTPAQLQAIAADLRRALSESQVTPTADDWFFVGTLLAAMERSPMRDSYALLTPQGLRQAGPAQTILLSLNAEYSTILRHRELGYSLHVMGHYQAAAGPAIKAWQQSAFETVRRSVTDIKRDYAALFSTVTAETGARFLVINRMSTSGQEDISNYAAFDAPMAATLHTIAAKELNLMLHELTEDHDVSIIDIDAIAAELGAGAHLPDGTHQSGLMQQIVRAEILRCLANHEPSGNLEGHQKVMG